MSPRLLVGTYTTPQGHAPAPTGEGVHALAFDPRTGELGPPVLVAALDNPSFLALHPGGRALYAVREAPEGRLWTLAPDGDGWRVLDERPSGDSAPAFVTAAPDGRFALVAHYGGGLVAGFPLGADGRPGEPVLADRAVGGGPHERQDGPHAHCVRVSPDGRFAHAADLGTDEVVTYDLAAPGGPRPVSRLRLPPGSGPRHLAFHPNGTLAYLTLELGAGVARLRLDPASGALGLLGVTPLGGGDPPSEAAVSPDGRFLYVGVRGRDTIAVLRADDEGNLDPVQERPSLGRVPRHFVLSADARFLLVGNQESGTVAVFPREAESGELGEGRTFPCPTPAGLLLLD